MILSSLDQVNVNVSLNKMNRTPTSQLNIFKSRGRKIIWKKNSNTSKSKDLKNDLFMSIMVLILLKNVLKDIISFVLKLKMNM